MTSGDDRAGHRQTRRRAAAADRRPAPAAAPARGRGRVRARPRAGGRAEAAGARRARPIGRNVGPDAGDERVRAEARRSGRRSAAAARRPAARAAGLHLRLLRRAGRVARGRGHHAPPPDRARPQRLAAEAPCRATRVSSSRRRAGPRKPPEDLARPPPRTPAPRAARACRRAADAPRGASSSRATGRPPR